MTRNHSVELRHIVFDISENNDPKLVRKIILDSFQDIDGVDENRKHVVIMRNFGSGVMRVELKVWIDSEKYLETILRLLVKGKIVRGLRGKGGGYMLTRSPEEYSVGEIIELTEGSLAPVACLAPGAETCPRKEGCATFKLWQKYDLFTRRFFYGITLQNLIDGDFDGFGENAQVST